MQPSTTATQALQIIVLIALLVSSAVGQTSNTDGSTPASLTPGSPAGSYTLSGFDNVNLFNGGLNFHLPLLSIGGRGEAQMNMMLPIEQKWRVEYLDTQFGDVLAFPKDNWWSGLEPGYGPGVVQGRITYIFTPVCDPNSTCCGGTLLTRITFTAPDGSEHELRDLATGGQAKEVAPCVQFGASRGQVFASADGSTITFISDTIIRDNAFAQGSMNSVFYPTGHLMFKDGTRYRIENGLVKSIRDRNGNKLTFSYDNHQIQGQPANRVIGITDSLNRHITITYDVQEAQPFGLCDKIQFNGFGGDSRTVRVSKKNLANVLRAGFIPQTYSQLFPEFNGTAGTSNPFNPLVTSAVWLPDNRSYTFLYNSYGELARVTLPTGGAYEYDFAAGLTNGPASGAWLRGLNASSSAADDLYRRVVEKRAYPTGGTGNTYSVKTRFSRPESLFTCGANNCVQTEGFVIVEDFDVNNVRLAKTKHYFFGYALDISSSFGLPGYPNWKDGKEHTTETFHVNGNNVLRRIIHTWEQRAPVSWWTGNPDLGPSNDPRIGETRTELTDVSPALVAKQVFDYDDSLPFNNRTDLYEYDFGSGGPGPLLRHSHTDYVTTPSYINANVNPALGAHIRGLPSQAWLSSDLNGTNKSSLATYEYDNYSGSGFTAALQTYPRPGISEPGIIGLETGFNSTEQVIRGNVTSTTAHLLTDGVVTGSISTHVNYDVAGNVIKTIDPRSTSSNVIATSVEFSDRFGSPDIEAQSNSAPVELGTLMTYAFPTKVTNALGHIGFTQYDYHLGEEVNTEDANGTVTSFEYGNGGLDLLDRPSRIIRAIGLTLQTQTKIVYDDDNRTVTTTSDQNGFDDNALKSQSLYDQLGRTFETRQYEDATNFIATRQEYDNLGRAFKSSKPFRQGETLFWTTNGYDSLGRVITVTTSDSAVVKTSYLGNKVQITDQDGRSRRTTNDALGRLFEVVEFTRTLQNPDIVENPIASDFVTTYKHDVLGNMRKVEQGGQVRFFMYDSLSRLIRLKIPEQGNLTPDSDFPQLTDSSSGTSNSQWSQAYNYDANGRLVKRKDARNITTTHVYDAINRPTNRSYSDGTPAVTYTYDSPDVDNSKGRLTSVTSSVSSYTYTDYDELGRVLIAVQTTDGHVYSMSYGYDRAGNVNSQTYPSGLVVTTQFDSAGRIAGVKNQTTQSFYAGAAANDPTNRIKYTPHGAIKDMKLGNGLWEHSIFNPRCQMTEIGLGTSQGSNDRLKINYSYGTTNNNGNLRSQTITVPTVGSVTGFTATQDYTYDKLNRLETAQETGGSAWTQNFTYDRFGNRNFTAGTTIPATLNALTNPTISTSNNRIDVAASGQTSATYDFNGNLTHDVSVHAFAYDAENKQKTYDGGASGSGGATYSYDGDGRRVKKIVGGPLVKTTIFVYNILGQIIAEYSDAAISGPGGTSYFTSDMLGNTRVRTGLQTEPNGGVRGRHDYLPFGEEILSGGARTAPQGYVINNAVSHKFTQKERDAESGLDYFGARYYFSEHGRFTSPDPLISSGRLFQPQSWNRYSYVINRPLALVDPDGLDWGVTEYEQDGKIITRYKWFHGKPGSYGGRKYDPVNFGSETHKDIHADDGTVVRIRNRGVVREVIYRGPRKIVITGQDTLDLAGGLTHGAARALAGVNPAAHALVDYAFDQVGGLDQGSELFSKGDTIGYATTTGVTILATAGAVAGAGASDDAAVVVREGIYEFRAASGKIYVGQSSDIPKRILQHIASGKLKEADLATVRVTPVNGGKTAREVAEQLRINELGGIKLLENIRNPIGRARQYLLPK